MAQDEKLPRRDWILLPAVSVLTIALLFVSVELEARRLFFESKTSNENCLVLTDAATGVRGIANSVCWEKIPEAQWVEYRFDNCGYRSGMQCGPKPPGTYRIVATGSSVAIGERVPVEKTYATLLPNELSRRTGRKIELYNEGMAYGFPRTTALRFQEVLAQKPDLILWVLTPNDIGEGEFVYAEETAEKPPGLSGKWAKLKEAIATNSIMDKVRVHVQATRSAVVLQHFLYKYESQNQYVQAYLMGPDHSVGFLKSDMSALWKSHLEEFEVRAADIEQRASSSGVPLAAVYLPNRAQAAMISMNRWPAGYDPYAMNAKLRAIITSHGGIFIDVLEDFREIPAPEQDYLPVDGHPTAQAHAIFARLIADALTGGSVPDLKAPAQGQIAREKGR